ncbi:hypothetical protein HBH56_189000 [Parastagonospora nodorum]|uniref:Uncharacterized protein n=1 Tax=Phaeosphaeria nodorum (strain SN15 / ATCC MYA-4574 / FGSC 10173) TaxID=321614 RepID=A0A7U2HVK3_PHANO|nr:hypothetical protein HBH56_189000 [Parastagonospora nodorum]QRC92293.1 hypothetical protein JI435_402200 [Parastagonospora nodorum SN15]KAH3925129.1 hypothetical protein HBH54_184810 [Parastagonospora nodorum]KAH3954228.1 hypothetical protein HBH53_024160 [Parastagonospora nodorum]KAH3963792.1 hypothetical protein HBH51_164000 [Parastagonospora nodorum]
MSCSTSLARCHAMQTVNVRTEYIPEQAVVPGGEIASRSYLVSCGLNYVCTLCSKANELSMRTQVALPNAGSIPFWPCRNHCERSGEMLRCTPPLHN